eukprot:PhF_6_TR27923/c0_g1_i1/m.41082/K21767/TBCD; tubulin-specific chaperone D
MAEDCPELNFFAERNEVLAKVAELETGEVVSKNVERLRTILEVYQEAPQLLIPHLHGLVDPAVAALRKFLTLTDTVPNITKRGAVKYELGAEYAQYDVDAARTSRHDVARYLYSISKIVGYKTLVPFFPHDVTCVTSVCAALAEWYMDPRQTHEWEVAYVLTLWLCNVVLVPFALKSFDDELCPKLVELIKHLLSETSRAREAAAFLAAKLFSRPDTATRCHEFILWSSEVLGRKETDTITRCGVLLAIAQLLKVGKRKELLQHVQILGPTILNCGTGDSTYFKVVVKATQRLGLLHLPPNSATWKYVKKRNTLLGVNSGIASQEGPVGEVEVPEDMETVLDVVLRALRHPDTVVRWSAAKGVGRLCSRLPEEAAVEVLEALHGLFDVVEDDAAWHGGCLALAEMVRRGLILPATFPQQIKFILKALQYDVVRGSHSVGAHVRDAGCYVCWSFARAYDPEVLAEYVNEVSSALLFAACYDREVNVRRAAAAAFQECVGRLGCFPHGIDIVTTADYFSLSLRKNSFLSVGPTVAQYHPYGPYFLQRLSRVTIFHWDKDVRQFATQALGILSKSFPTEIMAEFPRIVKSTLDASVDIRHGAILAVAEIVSSISREYLPEDSIKEVVMVVPRLEAQRLFRGRGGEYVRIAACHLIACMAKASVTLPDVIHVERAVSTIGAGKAVKLKTLQHLQDILEDCIKQAIEPVQEAALVAFSAFFHTYFVEYVAGHWDPLLGKMISMMDPGRAPNERRGSVLVLSTLPRCVLVVPEVYDRVFDAVAEATKVEESKDTQDAETRKNAVVAMLDIALTCFDVLPAEKLKKIEDVILRVVEDYSIDRRGDVGSMVRMAGVSAAKRYLLALQPRRDTLPDGFLNNAITSLLQVSFKQMMEKIDRVRAHVGGEIHILANQLQSPAHEAVLKPFVPADIDWSSPTFFDVIVPILMADDRCREHTLEGLAVSVGGLSVHVAKAARAALLATMRSSEALQDAICECLLKILQVREKVDRVVLPALSTVEMIITSGVFPIKYHLALSERVSVEIATCLREIHKQMALVDIVTVLCVSGDDTARRVCLQYAMRMIAVHAYPKVRGKTAQQLYTALLSSTLEHSEEVSALLLSTPWEDDNMEVIRKARDDIAAIFGVEKLPDEVMKGPGKKGASGVDRVAYAGLVREAGY